MVKQAEKRRQRSPLLPIFGLILAVGLFVLAYIAEDPLVSVVNQVAKQSITLPPPAAQLTPKFVMPSLGRLGVAFAIWLILLALAYTFVAVIGGRDPESAKGMQLPPRTKEERDKRYK